MMSVENFKDSKEKIVGYDMIASSLVQTLPSCQQPDNQPSAFQNNEYRVLSRIPIGQ